MPRTRFSVTLLAICPLLCGIALQAQSTPISPASIPPTPAGQAPALTPLPPQHTFQPLPTPTLSPAVTELLKLEDQFQQSVAKGGGKAFASWFAPDGVTLNNGKPAVQGQQAIASAATWNAASYQLQWYVEGAQMGPSNDAGFTWGHYQTHSEDASGKPLSASGRYITFWKKENGAWKVALDASAAEPPEPVAASQ